MGQSKPSSLAPSLFHYKCPRCLEPGKLQPRLHDGEERTVKKLLHERLLRCINRLAVKTVFDDPEVRGGAFTVYIGYVEYAYTVAPLFMASAQQTWDESQEDTNRAHYIVRVALSVALRQDVR